MRSHQPPSGWRLTSRVRLPPDLDLVLIQAGAEQWVNTASLSLLAELRRRAPTSIDWAAMGNIGPVLDAFEAAQESRSARRH